MNYSSNGMKKKYHVKFGLLVYYDRNYAKLPLPFL